MLLLILGIVLFLGTHTIATLRETRAGLIETAKRLDPLVLRWGK